jgi:hypothetical protein
MLRSRYMLIKPSATETDPKGNSYPDILTLPIDRFSFTIAPEIHILTQIDVERIDILVYQKYQDSNYDDLLLYVNKLESFHELVIGDKFILPDILDIDRFYLSNINL